MPLNFELKNAYSENLILYLIGNSIQINMSIFLNDILSPETTLGAILYGLIIIFVAWFLGRIFYVGVDRYLRGAQERGIDLTSVRFLGQLSRVIVYLFALIFYTHLIPSLRGFDTTWLASVGIISVIIGLATQSTLSNLIAGISLIIYRPFRIGDRIQVATPAGPEIGVVETIDLGYTSLRASNGRRIVLPNSIITNQTNINFSRNLSRVLLEVAVILPDAGDIERARQIFLECAKPISKITKINGCFVTGLGAIGTTVMLSAMCLDPEDLAQIKSDLLEAVKKQFDINNIRVA